MNEIRNAVHDVIKRHLKNSEMFSLAQFPFLAFMKSLNRRDQNSVRIRNAIYHDLIDQGMSQIAIAKTLGIASHRIRDEVNKEKKKLRTV